MTRPIRELDTVTAMELHVEPRVSKTWDAFRAENPPYSIALDGYVIGAPAFDPKGPHANFDHHADVDRLATRSTCMQVFMAISVGFFEVFQKDGDPHAHVFVNDPDQDTCLAVWLLRNPGRIANARIVQPLARLLLAEDILDCTGGAYPVAPNRPGMRQMAWVFGPYFDARTAGKVPDMTADDMRALIDTVCDRITMLADGDGQEVDLDTDLEEIGGGPGWKMIVEHGPHARTELFSSGVRAFVSVRDNDDGSWTYTLGRMSPFVRFPIDELFRRLNEVEGISHGADGWGGSNTIGGSPRIGGSKLDPKTLERLINEHLERA